MGKRFTDKFNIVNGLSCPNCHGSACMVNSGKGIGKGYRLFRRFACTKCNINTIHPVGIKNPKAIR
jgi:transposase-like protein